MEITTEKIEPGTERIRVQINHSDYDADFKRELKKAAQESNYKGFRKGKVPPGFVLRTQGQNILYNLIFKKINEILSEYIEKEGVDYLFDPLPSEDQASFDFDPSKKEDFLFLFDLCLPPNLSEMKGWGVDNTYKDYQLDLGDEEINERAKEFKKAYGEMSDREVVEAAQNPRLNFELNIPDGEGIAATETNIGFLWTELTNDFANKIDGAKPGDQFTGTFADFIVQDSHKHIVSQYLAANEMNEVDEEAKDDLTNYLATLQIEWNLDTISVFQEAEINEDFLKKVSGSGELIKDEVEFREKLAEMISSDYIGISRSIMLKKLRERVTEENELDMPEKFIREFVLSGDKEKELTNDIKKSVLWSVFSTTLAKKKGVQVSEQEVKSFLANQVINWMRGVQDQQLIMSMVDRMMEDKAAVDNATENIFINKLAAVVYEEVEKEVVKLKKADFDELIDEEFPKSAPDSEEEE
ncbi:MAG: hypothetical protein EA362_11020 [Saprospirales bacterium]|nr:MAG: hypothetical protein EA362_11020 [Saprospirales bacterium]